MEYILKSLLKDDCNLWNIKNEIKKIPYLAKFVLKHIAIYASSAPVERLFNVRMKFYTNFHTQLKTDNDENLILIKMNKMLWNEKF